MFQVEAHAGHVVRVTVSEGLVEVRYGNAISLVPAGGEWRPPQPPAEPSTLVSTAPRRLTAAPHRPASASDGEASRSFGDAVDLLGRGDYAAARTRLDAFRADHPSDDRADLAAFLTIVSLQRAGRRTEARDAARRYLELYPGGDRRADATRVAFER
jgi:TolA-binding protein